MEQRPQRQGYSDLNERQAEGVPALEEDDENRGQPNYPDLGSTGRSGTDTDVTRKAITDEGPADPYRGAGQSEPAADEDENAGDQGQDYRATSDAGQGLRDAAGSGGQSGAGADLAPDVGQGGAGSGGQRSGGDGGENAPTGG